MRRSHIAFALAAAGTCALSGSAPAPCRAQSIGGTKVATAGIYKEGSGATHAWQINGTHALVWDSRPYIPVGTLFAAHSLDFEGGDVWQKDVEALQQLKAHGVTDIVVAPARSMADVLPTSLQRLVSYLDANEFRYGLSFGKGIDRPLVGTVIRPTIYRYFEKDGITATWQVSATDAGLFTLIDADNGNRLVRADYITVNAPIVTLPLEVPSTVVGRVVAQFYPHKAMLGDNTLPDIWGGFDDYRDRLLGMLSRVKFGKGLRFFQDPLARHLGLSGETDFLVPDSPAFRLAWEAYLTQRYGTVERTRDAWSLAEGEFKNLRGMTFLTPLWEKTHGIPYFFDGATGKELRIVDAGRSRWWTDFLDFRDNEIEYCMNAMADLLKQQSADVPVVYTWTQPHPIFLNRARSGGYDGLCIPARGAGNALLARTLIPGFSHVEQAERALWCISSEIDPAAAATPPATKGPVLAGATQGGQPAVSDLTQSLESVRRVGVKGFFLGSLPDSPQPDAGQAIDAAAMDAARAYGARLSAEAGAAGYMPHILFYPQSTPGPAHAGLVPGSSSLWMGAYVPGELLDWWPSYDGYTLNNNQESVLVSLQGRRETHIWVPRPKDVQAFTPDGSPIPIKIINKTCILVPLDTTPTVFRTGGQRLVIQEATDDVFAQLNGLYEIAKERKMPELEAIRNVVDTLQKKYAQKEYEDAYVMAVGKVNELTALVQPYIWIEGERPSPINTFDEVALNPEASGSRYLTLFNPNAPPQKYDKYGYGVYYPMDVPREGVYDIWLAGSLPGQSVSPILWRIDSPPDMPIAEPSAHGPTYLGGRFGWMLLGRIRLSQGQHTLSIFAPERAASPPVYSFSIDAIMVTPGGFQPNGALRPPPVDAAQIRAFKLKKPEKHTPPARIPLSNYPIP